MKLIIAEKPSLGRTIAAALPGQKFQRKDGYLESADYLVSWCFGHLYNLQELDKYFPDYDPAQKARWTLDRLPFYPVDWEFQYEPRRDSKDKTVPDQGVLDQIDVLSDLMNRPDVDTIYHAGDADQEGQAIVDHVLHFNLKKKKPVLRLWLPALTKDAIQTAVNGAKDNGQYHDLYMAAITRDAEDWLLGIELTRFTSLKAGSFVRVGRCVCVIVEHIVERERAIRDFVAKPYTAVVSKEKTNGEEIELTSKKTFEEGHEAEAQALADRYNAAGAVVTDVKTERKTVPSKKLFSQTDLQSYVCKQFKSLTPADVLAAAQKLYEGGFLTYPRTNTNFLAKDESKTVAGVIKALESAGHTGLDTKAGTKSIYDDSKIESHSAIIPTTKLPSGLSGDEEIVYNTVLNRFMAVFCKEPCLVDRTTMTIQCDDEIFTLRGEIQVQAGWRRFEQGGEDKPLPRLKNGDKVNIDFKPVGKMTTPPKRYTVEALNNWMKAPTKNEDRPDDEYTDAEWKDILSDATICTEATRAETVDKCIRTKYISLKKGVYYAEDAGFYMVDALKGLNIDLGVDTTVQLSRDLYKVRKGELDRAAVLNTVKDKMDSIFAGTGRIVSQYAPKAQNTGGLPVLCKCPKCGGDVVETKRGAFACMNRCGVTLWKDNKLMQAIGKSMTASVAKKLLTDGKVPLKNCKSVKTGKTFDCILNVDVSGDRPELNLTFPEGATIGECPCCGAPVKENKVGYACTDENCRVILFKQCRYFSDTVNVTVDKAKKLFAGGSVAFSVTNRKGELVQRKFRMEPVKAKNGKTYLNLVAMDGKKSATTGETGGLT